MFEGSTFFVLYIKNIRKDITFNPPLVSTASQLVGNVGFSIILTVFLKVRHKVIVFYILICIFMIIFLGRMLKEYKDSEREPKEV